MPITPRRGFVRADGIQLVDDDGPILLRGVGLGNWLLPEGYMWHFGDDQSSPRLIEKRIEGLVGPERAAQFWVRYRNAFITEADFALIAELGFDHVRLPINARGVIEDDGTIREDGFELIERAVGWSEANGLRLLLDLHGAPGGQTGGNIDDAPNNKPELFMDPANRALTVRLWRALATRYRDRESILGYDLLNEPLPDEWQHIYADELVDVYRELTAAIRDIDDRHLIMYEGSHWATNWAPLAVRYDANQVLQFHRYWCPPDESSIDEYLEARNRLQTPIYMGEGGENTPGWIYAATRLYERHDIGWNFWPWKKLDTVTSPLSAHVPENWDLISEPAATPDPEHAWRILEEFLAAVDVRRCVLRTDVVDALFARGNMHLPAWAGIRDHSEITVQHLTHIDIPEGIWHHTGGLPYTDHEYLPVTLKAGSQLSFNLSRPPGAWSVDAHPSEALDVGWAENALTLRAHEETLVRAVTITP